MFSVLLAKFSSLKQKLCSLKGQVVTGWTNKDQVLIIPVKYLYTSLWAVKIVFMQFLLLLRPSAESFPKDTPAFHCFYFSNRFICNFEKGLLPAPPSRLFYLNVGPNKYFGRVSQLLSRPRTLQSTLFWNLLGSGSIYLNSSQWSSKLSYPILKDKKENHWDFQAMRPPYSKV